MTAHETEENLPFAVRKAMVDALYASHGVIVLGSVFALTLGAMAYIEFQDWILVSMSLVIVAVAAVRSILIAAYRRASARIIDEAALSGWKTAYLFGSVSTFASFGFLTAVGEATRPDSYFTYACVVTVLGGTLAVGARNYASRLVVVSASLAACVPAGFSIASEGIRDRHYSSFILIVLIVFVVAMTIHIGSYLRRRFLEALLSARKSELSSNRFNIAISSMPNGLIMVDGGDSVVVMNARAAEKLCMPEQFEGNLKDALSRNFEADGVDLVLATLAGLRAVPGVSSRMEMRLPTRDGRWMQCSCNALGGRDRILPEGETTAPHAGAAVIILQDVTDKVSNENQLLRAACFDKLSGLANRTHWERLADAAVGRLSHDELVAMCILDVDKFKLINDTLGHQVGDEVIAGVARNLLDFDDVRLIPGRMGGDEFVILVPGLAARDEVAPLFDRIFSAISRTYVVSGHNVEVRCSGGVIVRSRSEFDRQADMSRADMALYKVKRNPNQSWMVFDEHLEGEYQETSRIKHDLRKAIDDGSLQVVYQPIYDTKGEVMTSAEALCRWNHSEVGAISPAQFIAMAEEIGVIGKLTSYVLRTACRDCKAWGADVPVAVNLSAMDLARDDIVGMIEAALKEFELHPSRLCVEVTESVFVKDFAKTAATLRTLRDMGVKTSLDDFGTGYSSLSYLSQLPLNRVKIDRNFVVGICEDAKAQRLFRGVVSLAKELEFEVVVEGIEGNDELSFVRSVPGVDMIQGFVYSSPYTAEQMTSGFAARHLRVRTPRTQNLRLVGP